MSNKADRFQVHKDVFKFPEEEGEVHSPAKNGGAIVTRRFQGSHWEDGMAGT